MYELIFFSIIVNIFLISTVMFFVFPILQGFDGVIVSRLGYVFILTDLLLIIISVY